MLLDSHHLEMFRNVTNSLSATPFKKERENENNSTSIIGYNWVGAEWHDTPHEMREKRGDASGVQTELHRALKAMCSFLRGG